jgi:hypothetical protein
MELELDRKLIFHGAIIFLIAMASGWLLLAVPFRNPRMMLATHLAGVFGALLMMVVGMLMPQLELGLKARRVLVWSVVVSQYLFVLTGFYAAIVGTSSMFAGPANMRGTAVQEALAAAGNGVAVFGSTVAAVVLLWGLRAGKGAPDHATASQTHAGR